MSSPLGKRDRSSKSPDRDLDHRIRGSKVPRRIGPQGVRFVPLDYRKQKLPPRETSPDADNYPTSTVQSNWKYALGEARKLYKYTTLKEGEIRLLVIERAHSGEDDPIIGRLVHINVSELKHRQEQQQHQSHNSGTEGDGTFEYEALSYHWGSEKAEHRIFISTEFSNQNATFETATQKIQTRKYIKPNLFSALRCLRSTSEPIWLWVDAICINQDDTNEQTSQIAQMAQIYSLATNVCIWLGESDDQTKKAMLFIKKIVDLERFDQLIAQEYASEWRALVHLMKSTWFSRRWIIQELALSRSATVFCGKDFVAWDDMKDAIGLFAIHFEKISQYFSSSRQAGREFNESGGVFSVDTFGELHSLGAKILVDHTVNIVRRTAGGTIFEPTMGLEMLVSTLSTFDTGDPRDTIHTLRNICMEVPFSASGIVASAENAPPAPDYSKDLLEVYVEFLEWVTNNSDSLDILCRHWALPEKTKQEPINYPKLVTLPTWIQTVSGSTYGTPTEGLSGKRINGDPFVGLPGRGPYNASHRKRAEAKFCYRKKLHTKKLLPSNAEGEKLTLAVHPISTPRLIGSDSEPRQVLPQPIDTDDEQRDSSQTGDPSLSVKGLCLDTISWVSGEIADGVIPKAAIEKCGWNFEENKKEASKSGQYRSVPDKVWRTLVADRQPNGTPPPGLYHRACLYCLARHTPNGHINTKELLVGSYPGITREYLKRVQAAVWNRRFFESRGSPDSEGSKLVGLCPTSTEIGDKICILFGCSVPVILRESKYSRQPPEYEFVGEAYVYGKMDGEAILVAGNNLEEQTRTFRII